MSNKSGATANQDTLRTQAGLTAVQAASMSGADLMRAAYAVKAGLTTAQAANLSGSDLFKRTTVIDLPKQ